MENGFIKYDIFNVEVDYMVFILFFDIFVFDWLINVLLLMFWMDSVSFEIYLKFGENLMYFNLVIVNLK